MLRSVKRQHSHVWLLFVRNQSTTSTMEPLTMRLPTVCVWGSNTGVGKTLFSAGISAACERAKVPLLYLKPVQTGFPQDSDTRLVAAACKAAEEYGPHAAALLPSSSPSQQRAGQSLSAGATPDWWLTARTLFAWSQPISPHLAVEREGRQVADADILGTVARDVNTFADHIWPPGRPVSRPIKGALSLVETAGGPCSPGPSGTLQCDLLRPLRLPGILVGDGRLGGISATLSALDTLLLRGYDIPLILLMDQGLGNAEALRKHVAGRAEVIAFPPCPPPPETAPGQQQAQQQFQLDEQLLGWLGECKPKFDRVLDSVLSAHQQRTAQLQVAAQQAQRVLWWPFTQHGTVAGNDKEGGAVTVIDSRAGESFAVWRPQQGASSGWKGNDVQLQYDACASWWTQGVSQEAHPRLVKAMSYAAGRYGHVMFPENVHDLALKLAQRLVSGVGRGWASRVFYSDNGSTAIEVALKMAFRKFMVDQGILEEEGVELQVLGLTEAYHGDTLGAMDAVSPSPYNGRRQTPWYRPRGLFLDPPTVALVKGEWRVRLPAGLQEGRQHAQQEGERELPTLDRVFAPGRDESPLAQLYREHIRAQLAQYAQQQGAGARLGALIMEPVLQGAGGMRFVDPLFQRQLVLLAREAGIPVILDEVFTGIWRLGAPSGAHLLWVSPDIACYAKLLTGGMIPLSTTLATEEVFDAFHGDSKMHALLHGHSYTAHAPGCGAALEALSLYEDPSISPNYCCPPGSTSGEADRGPAQQAQQGGSSVCWERCATGTCTEPCGRMLPLWDEARARELSRHPRVEGVVALGTVLAVELKTEQGGYASEAAREVTGKLRREGGIFARPLGNVVYLMVTPMTRPAQCDALLEALEAALRA